MLRIIYILFTLSFLLSSCVTNKDIDLFSIKNNTKIKVSNSSTIIWRWFIICGD